MNLSRLMRPSWASVRRLRDPSGGDAAVFGLLRDHILTGYVTREELAVLTAYEVIPEVKKWLDSLEKKLTLSYYHSPS